MGAQEALLYADHIRIKVCPQKVRGSWNCFGTSDLRACVLKTAPTVLRELGVKVTAEIRKELETGNYKVREVHVAHHFHLPNYSTTEFLQNMRLQLRESYHVNRMPRGRGLYINERSRRVECAIYDKLFEFHAKDSGLTRYAVRIEAAEGIQKMGLMIDRDLHQYIAALGPRMELRFGDNFFREGGKYTWGHQWDEGRADRLFQKHLETLDFPKWVNATWARNEARRKLSRADYVTYRMWEMGEPLSVAAGSGANIARKAARIQAAVGVNIRQSAAAVLGEKRRVQVRDVFAWENRVDVDTIDLDKDLGSLHEHVPPFD